MNALERDTLDDGEYLDWMQRSHDQGFELIVALGKPLAPGTQRQEDLR